MLNIVILTNQNKYSYHTAASSMIGTLLSEQKHTATILDITSFRYDHECINKIKELEADVLITLDLAGFHIRTQSGETALNMLLTKNLNLIWGNKAEYAPFLQKKLSLSMLFYDVSGTDNKLGQQYLNLLYYQAVGRISRIQPEDVVSVNTFLQIWENFLLEIL